MQNSLVGDPLRCPTSSILVKPHPLQLKTNIFIFSEIFTVMLKNSEIFERRDPELWLRSLVNVALLPKLFATFTGIKQQSVI